MASAELNETTVGNEEEEPMAVFGMCIFLYFIITKVMFSETNGEKNNFIVLSFTLYQYRTYIRKTNKCTLKDRMRIS